MWNILQPSSIHFGAGAASEYDFPEKPLLITSKGAKSRGWTEYLKLKNFQIFDQVEPNPSIETTEKIISEFKNENFSTVIGLGGGSSLDVAKYVGYKLEKKKIMIPTTFGIYAMFIDTHSKSPKSAKVWMVLTIGFFLSIFLQG